MKLKVLGCYGGQTPELGMTSFLVNDSILIDAGFATGSLTLDDQSKIRDVLISHSHLDHTCTLPFLIDNNFSAPGFALRIFTIPPVVAAMKDHLFNNLTWPDFTCLPNDLTPVLRLTSVEPEEPFEAGGLTIRAVLVSHNVPTAGWILEDGRTALAFSSDTGPTERFWKLVNPMKRLGMVITEVSFPNEMASLAKVSGHLTPALLGEELKKLKQDVPVYLYGLKPRFIPILKKQVRALKDPRVHYCAQGRTYKL